MRERRLFNIRPVCLFALFFMGGILVAEALYRQNKLYIAIPLTLAAAGFLVMLFLAKPRRFAYIPLAFVIGLAAMSIANNVYDSRVINYIGVFQADVASEITVDEYGTASFIADNLVIDGEKAKGRITVGAEIDGYPDFGAGDTVVIVGKIKGNEHIRFDSLYAYYSSNRFYGSAYATFVGKLAEASPPFPLNLQISIKRLFYENCDPATASICQALVLGDKRGMDGGLYDDIKAGGLAHVLAVSGLHITALASALFWLLRKTKLDPRLGLGLVTVLTFFYVMLCSFTASALRAFIMTFVFNFSALSGRKRDALSSLAFAASLILIFSPTSALGAGFLLSVFAILGIFVFYSPFRRVSVKLADKIAPSRLPENALPGSGDSAYAAFTGDSLPPVKEVGKRGKTPTAPKERPLRRFILWVGGVFSVSFAANLLTFPFIAFMFGEVPVLFVLSNLIILPYAMFIYLFLLIITPFALITTLHGLVGIMDFLLVPFKGYVSVMGSIPYAVLPVAISVTGIVCYLLSSMLLSRFIFLTRRRRAVAVLSTAAVSLAVGCLIFYL